MTYVYYRGMDKYEIELCDSVAIILDDGTEIELQFRRSDGEVSLSAARGQLHIEPRAANTVRLRVTK